MLEKIVFGYDSDYPETMWAEKISEGIYRLDNIPFFTDGISYMDIFSVKTIEGDGRNGFFEIVKREGHTTIHVIFSKDILGEEKSLILDGLLKIPEVSYESGGNIFGVDIGIQKSVGLAVSMLEDFNKKGKLIFEISCNQTDV